MSGDLMIYLVPAVILIALLAFGVATLGRSSRGESLLPVGALLNRDEQALLKALQEAVGKDFAIYPKVSLAALANSPAPPGGAPAYVDIVLCRHDTSQAVLVVELVGDQASDLEKTCQQMGLRLLAVPRAKVYNVAQLTEQVTTALQ